MALDDILQVLMRTRRGFGARNVVEALEPQVVHRGQNIPFVEYDDGSVGWGVPRLYDDLKDSWNQFTNAAEAARGIPHTPEESFPRPQDAGLAGVAMAGSGLGHLGLRGRLSGSVAGAERAEASSGLPSSPVGAGSSPLPPQFRGKAPLGPAHVKQGLNIGDDTGAWFLDGDKPTYANATRESLDRLYGPEYAKRFDKFKAVESADADGNKFTIWMKPNITAAQRAAVDDLHKFQKTYSPTRSTAAQAVQHDRLQGLAYGYDPAKVEAYVAKRSGELGLPSHSVEAGSFGLRPEYIDTPSGFNRVLAATGLAEPEGTRFRYAITKDGADTGAFVNGQVKGDTARIDWMGEGAETGIDAAKNTLGVSGLRQLREAVRNDFPDVKNFEGRRVSGARPLNAQQKVTLFSNPKDATPTGVLAMDAASRMERARAQGFDPATTWYHGTDKAFDEFSLDKAGQGASGAGYDTVPAVWFQDNPQRASGFATGGGSTVRDGANVIPAHLRGTGDMDVWDMGHASIVNRREEINQALREAQEAGAPGVVFQNLIDTRAPFAAGASRGANVAAIFDPKNIRSKFAAFDPSKSDSANLLAANPGSPAGLLATGEGEEDDLPPIVRSLLGRAVPSRF
jgi:hypothetical protein